MTQKKFTPPDAALPNFARALGHLAEALQKMPKEPLINKTKNKGA